ncbi:protein odr-4 homolog [Lineus longissimus]|uniref:protein odr-4 homolog n=1 Tax=Lineus longissimus TaxID=88925 RepID=UPI002B4DC086
MGRTIICEESNQAFINDIYNEKNAQTGLLIGQLTPQRDYVVLMVATPIENEPEEEEDNESDGVKTRSKASRKSATLDSISESWVTYHAKQVVRMMPGGLDVIGLYAAANTKELEKCTSKLRQLVFAVHKTLSKSQLTPKPDEAITDRILLQICTLSRKLTCKSIDVGDNQSVLRPAEWKFQTAVDKWSILRTKLALDYPIYIPKQEADMSKKLQTSLKSIRKLVWSSLGTITGNIRDDSEVLQVSQEGPKKTRSGKGYSQDMQQKFAVELFLTPVGDCESEEDEEGKAVEIGTNITIRGTIQGEAFIHGKATVKEGLQALKCDVFRSLQARCSLMCEDQQASGDGPNDGSRLQTPRRVFAKLPEKKITLCDYMFGDEEVSDVLDRFQEVLGITLEEKDMILDRENIPSEEEMNAAEEEGATTVSVQKTSGLPGGAMIGAVVTGAVSALAAAFSYMYLQE